MTRNHFSDILDFDPEIERTIRRLRRDIITDSFEQLITKEEVVDTEIKTEAKEEIFEEEEEIMVEEPPKTNLNFARPTLEGTDSTVVKLTIGANNFEIKGVVI